MLNRIFFMGTEFYKKEAFTGSFKGMRFRLRKVEKEIEEEGKEPVKEKYLECCYWPEPFNFANTPDEQKVYEKFEFSDKGIDTAVEWLDKEYEQHFTVEE